MVHPHPPPPPSYERPPGNGSIAWIVGLVVLLCVPFVGSLLACVLMIWLGLAQRVKGELAAHNGVRAANWSLTYLLATIVLVGGHFLMIWFLTSGDKPPIKSFFPVGIPITVWGVVSLVHVVMCICGAIVSSQNKPFSGNGIPFIRASR